jgi:mono/diheme cytochrome c family protein
VRRTISIWGLTGTLAVLVATLLPGNSVLAGSSAKSRGAELFAAKGCAHCHGPAGVGGGKGPDLQKVRERRNRKAIMTQIHDGGKSMPPFDDELSSKEISNLASFLLARRKFIVVPPKPPVKPATSPSDKDPD